MTIIKSLKKFEPKTHQPWPMIHCNTKADCVDGADVMCMIHKMLVLAIQHCHTCHQWTNIWSLFIEKDLGNPHINQLCMMHLFQANLNLILKWFGKIATNQPSFKKVLLGTIELEPQINPYIKKLFQTLQHPTHIQEIKPRSLQEYSDGWQKAHGATSLSLLGIHFGHYMAGTFNPDILIFIATMADILLKMGYSPKRWCEGLNVMLEKSPRNFNVKNYE